MDKIVLKDLHFWGAHGVYPEERLQKQEFAVSVKIYLDLNKASGSDNLEDTFNYAELIPQLRQIVEEKSYALLECLAGKLADCVLTDKRVQRVKISVTKCRTRINDYTFAPTVVLERVSGKWKESI